ncbi:MAG: bifunctional histidinol-phosphatase/imidazoleglycerol-phosphate dehydratase HisB [Gammaproteobacteria bacterium]|nr:bifunctional histidinol-phosphatase/imidazoleglycerol-phosphate dehydratase HisB [Gammaproteobacteria bacterium]MDH5303046.1 bifunctional histidinol-phosphatase/imidazoleglycerol-phosphate dehydratase HisB [Gammaproteobacteria bacterium]MDH5321208.1 bifunctional histidinol-phosphatase/imidazoleglycerol-phosphate dehydratase HisB [Gammaproteobacteria bacterium]
MKERILFIDRDGTLVVEPADNQVDSLEKVQLVGGVIPALLELAAHGYRFVMVSNQDGLGTAAFPTAQFQLCQDHILALFASQGVMFDEIFICPHTADEGCECRKPRAGLLTGFLAAHNVDLRASAVIGDRDSDLQLAKRIGVRGFLIDPGDADTSWRTIVTSLCYSERSAEVKRRTSETNIQVAVNLDKEAPVSVATGIGFYDHMLEQIARHGGFSLTLQCDGDTEIDDHHTVEDTAICLGTALRDALGNKLGIDRYGFVVPMDESEAQVSIDLSGRSYLLFEGKFPADRVGEMSTEMVQHFFRSLADSLGAALHIRVHGMNTHHMVEACFKAVGRVLRQSMRRDGTTLPSTKGALN